MDPAASLLRWPSATVLMTTTAIATASLLALARATLWPRRGKVLRGPPRTGAAPQAPSLDELPGARDVDTPVSCARAILGDGRG